jgi:hypothetical protein
VPVSRAFKVPRPWGMGQAPRPDTLLSFLAGCATSAQTGGDPELERYPAPLIAAAEPVAPAVGFVLSRVRWRGGYLRGRDDVLEHLARRLQPLDIMLLNNRGRLSGRSGAGLFSHAAVYLGNEQQLRRNGLWNQASVVPHQEALRSGRTIIESEQRHGTSLSTLLHASDSDRIVILRPRDRGATGGGRQWTGCSPASGHAFDHRFRLDDEISIFCTQLVDMAMPELDLPRRTAYGRESSCRTTSRPRRCAAIAFRWSAMCAPMRTDGRRLAGGSCRPTSAGFGNPRRSLRSGRKGPPPWAGSRPFNLPGSIGQPGGPCREMGRQPAAALFVRRRRARCCDIRR